MYLDMFKVRLFACIIKWIFLQSVWIFVLMGTLVTDHSQFCSTKAITYWFDNSFVGWSHGFSYYTITCVVFRFPWSLTVTIHYTAGLASLKKINLQVVFESINTCFLRSLVWHHSTSSRQGFLRISSNT